MNQMTRRRLRHLAFKIATDPFVGNVDVFPRLLRCVELRRSGYTTRSSPSVSALVEWCRCTRITVNEIKEVRAGDIAAAIGLKDVTTGDTLCDPGQSDHP